ncbi:MAG: hypothetical protein ACRBBS_02630 [Thalassovita sp.]
MSTFSDMAVGAGLWGETLTYLTYLKPDETVRLDASVLGELYLELGEAGAQNVVTRAMEDLTQRLTDADQMYRDGDFLDLRKTVRATVAVAEQIGMRSLARCAQDVVACIDAGDPVALAAVLARLMRIGERSLNAVWDLQGLSI